MTASPGIRPRTPEEMDHAGSALNRAAAQTLQADPFSCRTEWGFSYHELQGNRRRLHLVEGEHGFVALAEVPRGDGVRVFEPVESLWHFGCPLLGTEPVAVLAEFLAPLEEKGTPFGLLLSGLVASSPLVRELGREFAARLDLVRHRRVVLQSASLEGGMDGWLGRRSGHFRRRLRATLRRAAELGIEFERRVPRTAAEAAAVYERMLAVERKSWKGIGECGMAEGWSSPFYGTMLRRLAAAGDGRVVFARAQGQDIGFVFGGMAGGHYRGQQFSYAEDWSRHSVGNLLQHEQLHWLCEEGALRYDMGPWMEYKTHWTEVEQVVETRVLRTP